MNFLKKMFFIIILILNSGIILAYDNPQDSIRAIYSAQIKNDSTSVIFFSNLSKEFSKKGAFYDSAYYFADKALSLAKATNSKYLKIKARGAMGEYLMAMEQNDSALTYFEEDYFVPYQKLFFEDSIKDIDFLYEIIDQWGAIGSIYSNKKNINDPIDKSFYLSVANNFLAILNQKLLTKKQLEFENEKKNKFILIISSIFLAIVCILAFFFVGRQKRLLKTIRLKNEQIEMQKNLVEEKQKEIIDSINYAKRIQQAQLPTEKYIERTLQRLKNK